MSDPLPMGDEGDEVVVPQSDPWASARAAGFDPEQTDWDAVAQGLGYLNDLSNPDMHKQVVERSLHEWGHLPENMTLDDIVAANQPAPPGQAQSAQANPFPTEPYGYTVDGDPIWHNPQQQPPQAQNIEFDPEEFKQQIETEMREKLLPEAEGKMQAQMIARDLDTQMAALVGDKGLNEQDTAFLWDYVTAKLERTDELGPRDIEGYIGARYKELESFSANRMGEMVKEQMDAPNTVPQQSSGEVGQELQRQPNRNWIQSAVEQTGRRMGIDPMQP